MKDKRIRTVGDLKKVLDKQSDDDKPFLIRDLGKPDFIRKAVIKRAIGKLNLKDAFVIEVEDDQRYGA